LNYKTKALVLLSIVTLAAVAGSLIVFSTVKADDNTTSTDNLTTATTNAITSTDPSNVTGDMHFGGPGGPGGPGFGGCPRGMERGFGQIQVSDEFKANVTTIAKADSDVQNLLNSGYNVTSVRPIVTTTIDANGNVVTKATSAVLGLEKDTTGRAMVLVNLEQAKVTRIEIETRTIIEK
jgi:hypothetical protein